jgi:hypothetical protein
MEEVVVEEEEEAAVGVVGTSLVSWITEDDTGSNGSTGDEGDIDSDEEVEWTDMFADE